MKILIMCLIIFYGCVEQLEENRDAVSDEVPEIGMINYPVETLTRNEISLSKSFCDALNEKEQSFPRNYMGATITFRVKKRECSENKSDIKEAVIKARLGTDTRSGNLRYFPMDYYLPMMTDIETINQGIFSEYCPDILLNTQKTNARESFEGQTQIFRLMSEGSDQIMAQVLTSDEPLGEVSKIQEVVVQVTGTRNRPKGLVTRKIELDQCGNLMGNANSNFWSQEI